MSADPNSFEDTGNRIGPDIHDNTTIANSINALFVRIRTEFGSPVDRLEVAGRWDDTDIVHVVTENLLIAGTPGGPAYDLSTGDRVARTDGRLAIDPGVVVKLEGARIEVAVSAG